MHSPTEHSPSSGETFLTVGEAARMSNLSVDTIRRYSKAGTLPTLRNTANHRLFRLEDVEALNQRRSILTVEQKN